MFRLAATLGALLAVLLGPRAAAIGAPTPFSPLPPMSGALAQAEQAPPESVPPAQPTAEPEDQAKPEKPAPPPLFVPPLKPGGCRGDADCARGKICEDGVCTAPQQSVSALFYFYKPGASGHRMVIPFYFSFWHPGSRTRVVVPFYGQKRDEEHHTSDLVLPLLLYRYHSEPGETSHQIWPIFFYSNYGQKGGAAGLLPLYFYRRKGPETLAVLPPLLSFYKADRDRRASDLLLAVFAYFHKRGDTRTTVVPPLLSIFRSDKDSSFGLILLHAWYWRNGERSGGGLFPLIWHFADRHGHSTVVLPLFVEGEDRDRGLRHITLLPLFHYRRDDHLKTRLTVTPLGGQYTDQVNHVKITVLLLPPLGHRDDPQHSLTVVPPLALWWRNKETGKSLGYVGPVFWNSDDEGEAGGLFPVYYRFHDRRTGGTTHILFPIAALHRSRDRAFGFLGPLYGWSTRGGPGGQASKGGGLFPLLMFGTGPSSHLALLPPLFIYARDREAGSRHVSLGPFFYRSHTQGPARGYDAGVFPLLFFGCRAGTAYQMLLPVFFHSKGWAAEHLVLGPLWVNRTFARAPGDPQAGVSAGLFPLLWIKSSPAQSYAVLPPLIWVARNGQKRVGVIGPVFWHSEPGPSGQGRQSSGGVLPLVYVSTARGTGNDGTVVVTPLGGYRSDPRHRFLLAGPFVHAERKLGPGGSGGRETTDALLPLLFFYRGPQRSAHVVFPLYWQGRDGDSTVRSALLLYYGVKRPGLTAHVLFPVFWRVATAQSSTTVVGPLFYSHRYDGKGSAGGLFPLFGYARSERATTVVTPIGFYRHNIQDERTRTFFGLFYGDFRKGRSDYGLIPLLFGWRRGTTSAWLAPLAYHASDPAQQRSVTVLGPLYFGHKGAASYGGLVPLFFGKRDGQGSYQFTFFPLFHVSHDAGKEPVTRLFTPLFGFVKGPTGSRGYFLPIYVRRDAEAHSEAVLPLFYHSWSPKTEISTTLLLPLLYRRRTPESTLTAVTPLFWQYNTLTRTVAFAFPLVLDVHDLYHKRLTMAGPLIPLFIRQRDYAENTTTWLFPPLLTYVKRHEDGRYHAVVFPIFWHFGGAHTTTILFPLLWHFRRPSYSTDVFFPLFFRYKDENGSTTVLPLLLTYVKRQADGGRSAVVFPLFWHGSGGGHSHTVLLPLFAHWKDDRAHHVLVLNTYTTRGVGAHQGEWSFHFWPLFSVGRPRKQDVEWNIFGGFIGYTRVRDTRTLRLLWGIFIPLRPATTSLRQSGRPDVRMAR